MIVMIIINNVVGRKSERRRRRMINVIAKERRGSPVSLVPRNEVIDPGSARGGRREARGVRRGKKSPVMARTLSPQGGVHEGRKGGEVEVWKGKREG